MRNNSFFKYIVSRGRKLNLFQNALHEAEIVSDEWKLEGHRFYSLCIWLANFMPGLKCNSLSWNMEFSLLRCSIPVDMTAWERYGRISVWIEWPFQFEGIGYYTKLIIPFDIWNTYCRLWGHKYLRMFWKLVILTNSR